MKQKNQTWIHLRKKRKNNSAKIQANRFTLCIDEGIRSSCLLGDTITSNLLKRDPEKSSVSRVESFMNV